MSRPGNITSLLLFTFVLWLAGVFNLESTLSYVFTLVFSIIFIIALLNYFRRKLG